MATDAAILAARSRSEQLAISQGSLISSALEHVCSLPNDQLITLITEQGHLTPEEQELVLEHLETKK